MSFPPKPLSFQSVQSVHDKVMSINLRGKLMKHAAKVLMLQLICGEMRVVNMYKPVSASEKKNLIFLIIANIYLTVLT